MLDSGLNDQVCSQTKESLPTENIEAGHAKLQQFSKTDNGNSSAIHPMRSLEDDNHDYDSNASSSSFEFHKGERVVHNSMTRSYSRPMSSKWNDAEKWIMNRQKHASLLSPDSAYYDLRSTVNRKADTRQFDFYQPVVQMPLEKFSTSGPRPSLAQPCGGNLLSDQFPQSTDLSCSPSSAEDATGKFA
ncbi:hypothetical protein V6N13_033777 [Hibiscus sabdariffa]